MNNIGIDFIGGESGMGNLEARSGYCANNTVWNIHSLDDGSAAGIYVDGGSNITIEFNQVHHSDIGIEIGAENKGRIANKIIVQNNFLHQNTKIGLAFGGYDQNRGRVTNRLFQNNQLEQNDVNRTGNGEMTISYASSCKVLKNIIKPNEQNVILWADKKGGLNNQFDYQIYYPYGTGANGNDLIFYWGDNEYDGLTAFQKSSKQEIHAQVKL